MAPKVEIVFGAKVEEFAKGVGMVRQKLNNLVPSELRTRLGGMLTGVFSVAALKRILSAADDIATFSKRLSVSTKTIQEWQHAAAETDTSIQAFTTAFRTMVQAQADAMAGRNPEAESAFGRMGLDVEKLRSLSPEQLFKAVGDAVQQTGDGTEALNDGITVLGRSALEILPAMRDGLSEFADEAERLGLIMAEDVVQQLADANDEMDRLKRQAIVQGAPIATGAVNALDYGMTKAKQLLLTGKGFLMQGLGRWGEAGEAHTQSYLEGRGFLERHKLIDPADMNMSSRPMTKGEINKRRRELGLAVPGVGEMNNYPPMPEAAAVASLAPTADALARIGLFRGGAGIESRLDRQIQVLQWIRSELRELNALERTE